MINPVFALDGKTYEKEAILAWFKIKGLTSPADGSYLKKATLIANMTMREGIEQWHASLQRSPPSRPTKQRRVDTFEK